MSQKTDIIDMLEQDKSYDEIEDRTGSKRSYIRSIAVNYRKRDKESELPETKDEPKDTKSESDEERPSMTFIDDTKNDSDTDKPIADKTGYNQHKEWVKAAKYECGHCGATIGKTQDFCAHCGKTLEWEGIE